MSRGISDIGFEGLYVKGVYIGHMRKYSRKIVIMETYFLRNSAIDNVCIHICYTLVAS